MPRNSRQIIAEAQSRFPIRIAIKVPRDGFGQRYTPMEDWLDEHCGLGGWSMTPAGIRGVINDAVAIYVSSPTCAVAFVARWCTDPEDGFYRMREDEPARRVPTPAHKSPP